MKLKEVIDFKNGKKRPKAGGNIPIYGGNGILGYTNQFNSTNNNIIIGRVGAYCGSVYKCTDKCWISDNAIVGKVKNGNDFVYLYYLLKSINLNNYHIGTSQPLITQDILNNLDVNIVDNKKQIKIGKILNTIENKIELKTNTNTNLLQIGNELFKEELNNSNDNEILQNVIKFVKGKKPNDISNIRQEGYEKYLTIACLNAQELNYANTTKMVMSNNNLLMVMDGASSGEVYYGGQGIVGSTLAKVECVNNHYISEFIYFAMRYYRALIQSKNTGSAIPHTDKVFVGTLEIPMLDYNQQEKYKVILAKIQKNRQENENLKQLRDTLLSKLMNGEINLDKIEI